MHKGDDLERQADLLLDFLSKQRLVACGDVYVTEMVNFFNTRGLEGYVREIAIPVCPDGEAQ